MYVAGLNHDMRLVSRMLSREQVVFPGFEPLDVFGPLEMFYSVRLVLTTLGKAFESWLTNNLSALQVIQDDPFRHR